MRLNNEYILIVTAQKYHDDGPTFYLGKYPPKVFGYLYNGKMCQALELGMLHLINKEDIIKVERYNILSHKRSMVKVKWEEDEE